MFTENFRGLDVTAGYAGSLDSTSPLCYPNPSGYHNYEKLGFAETVTMSLNSSQAFQDAASIYFKDFSQIQVDPPIWSRKDFFDQGAPYRAVVGMPGGLDGKHGPALRNANVREMKLVEGNGSDSDTIFNNSVLVYDSNKFHFFQAEACLQYHDDNNEQEPYSANYHDILAQRMGAGSLEVTGCPNNYINTCSNGSMTAVMLQHLIQGKWRSTSSRESRQRAMDCLSALPSQVPEIATYAVGADIGLTTGNSDFGLVGEFRSVDDFKTYEASEPHQACLALLKPLLAEKRGLEFWISSQTKKLGSS